MNVVKRMWTAAAPAWRCLLLSALLLAAGCAGGGDREVPVRFWDLGGVPATAKLSPAKAGVVRAGPPRTM